MAATIFCQDIFRVISREENKARQDIFESTHYQLCATCGTRLLSNKVIALLLHTGLQMPHPKQ